MSASKIFGALLWLLGAAIIVVYSAWVALQLVSKLTEKWSSHCWPAALPNDDITIPD